MNAKQLLLGLSILVPAVCGAKFNSPIQENIEVPIKVCEIRRGVTNEEKSRIGLVRVICFDIEYRVLEGMVTARVDTWHGTYIGFAVLAGLGIARNEMAKAAEDLVEKKMEQYPEYLGTTRFVYYHRLPRKLY